jgi:hypothetical protein
MTVKLGTSVSNVLTNKWVLKLVALVAFLNVIGYVVLGNVSAVLYFIVFAVLVRYFSENMTLVLGVPLILVNVLALKGNILEGMENNQEDGEESQDNKTNTDKKSKENGNGNGNGNNKDKSKPDAKTGQGLGMKPVEDGVSDDNAAQTTGGEQQGFEAGRRKNRGYEIDYATTVEDAYDQLNEILGGEGIKRLTADTQGLMKQQMQLAEAMKGMGPVIQQMGPMVENLKGMMGKMGDGKDGFGGILDLAKQFSK